MGENRIGMDATMTPLVTFTIPFKRLLDFNGSQEKALTQALEEAFKLSPLRLRREAAANRYGKLCIVSTLEQFGRFIVLRNMYGAANWTAELEPVILETGALEEPSTQTFVDVTRLESDNSWHADSISMGARHDARIEPGVYVNGPYTNEANFCGTPDSSDRAAKARETEVYNSAVEDVALTWEKKAVECVDRARNCRVSSSQRGYGMIAANRYKKQAQYIRGLKRPVAAAECMTAADVDARIEQALGTKQYMAQRVQREMALQRDARNRALEETAQDFERKALALDMEARSYGPGHKAKRADCIAMAASSREIATLIRAKKE